MALPTTCEWRPVASNPDYSASALGEIRHNRPGAKSLKGSIDKDGYRRVCLNGKTLRVHRLVCAAFHGPCPFGLECAHLDGNPLNNAAANLSWATHKENVGHSLEQGTFSGFRSVRAGRTYRPRSYGPRKDRGVLNKQAAFDCEQVAQIRKIRDAGASYRDLGRQFGCAPTTIFKIVKGQSYAE